VKKTARFPIRQVAPQTSGTAHCGQYRQAFFLAQ
jgi:hypothetical protein